MGFSIKNKGGKDYVYFYLGSEGPYYLCPKDNPTESEVPNVFKALDYTTKKSKGFTEDERRLIGMLPSKDKDEYLSTRLEEIKNYSEKLINQLSDPAKQQYLSKGKQTAEDQTRLRRVVVLSNAEFDGVSVLAKRLGLDPESEKLAIDLLKVVGLKMPDVPIKILIASCVYIAIKLHGSNFSEKEVAEKAGVSSYSINLAINKMRTLFNIVVKLDSVSSSTFKDKSKSEIHDKEVKKDSINSMIERSSEIIEFGKLCSDILNLHSRILLVYVLDREGKIVEELTRKGFDDFIPKKGGYMDSIILDVISQNFEQGAKFTFSPRNKISNFIFPLNEYYILVIVKTPIDAIQVGNKIVELIELETKGQTTQTPTEEEDGLVREERSGKK